MNISLGAGFVVAASALLFIATARTSRVFRGRRLPGNAIRWASEDGAPRWHGPLVAASIVCLTIGNLQLYQEVNWLPLILLGFIVYGVPTAILRLVHNRNARKDGAGAETGDEQ